MCIYYNVAVINKWNSEELSVIPGVIIMLDKRLT